MTICKEVSESLPPPGGLTALCHQFTEFTHLWSQALGCVQEEDSIGQWRRRNEEQIEQPENRASKFQLLLPHPFAHMGGLGLDLGLQ